MVASAETSISVVDTFESGLVVRSFALRHLQFDRVKRLSHHVGASIYFVVSVLSPSNLGAGIGSLSCNVS